MTATLEMVVCSANRTHLSQRFGKSMFTEGALRSVVATSPRCVVTLDHHGPQVVGSVYAWRFEDGRLVASARLDVVPDWLRVGSPVSMEATLENTRLDIEGVYRILGFSIDAVSLLSTGSGAFPCAVVTALARVPVAGATALSNTLSERTVPSSALQAILDRECLHDQRREPCPRCGSLGWHWHPAEAA